MPRPCAAVGGGCVGGFAEGGGTCSSRSGWTGDGLHPTRAVLLQYMSVAMNLAADLGEHCNGGGGDDGGDGGGGGGDGGDGGGGGGTIAHANGQHQQQQQHAHAAGSQHEHTAGSASGSLSTTGLSRWARSQRCACTSCGLCDRSSRS